MVNNGYISFVTETGGSQDTNGNPVPTTKVSSAYIECNFKIVKKEYKTFIDGQYMQASYSIYVDSNKIGSIALNSISLISLKDSNSNSLGEHQIHNVEYLKLSKSVKIVV